MNALRQFFAIYCLLAAIAVQSQNRPLNLSKDDRQLRGGPSLNDSFNRSSQDQDSLFGKRSRQLFTEKRPITDYLIISQDRDTTFVDTTLSVEKQYKFNFHRKDDFEYLTFANTGQTVNHLSLQSAPKSILPTPGYGAKMHQMFLLKRSILFQALYHHKCSISFLIFI